MKKIKSIIGLLSLLILTNSCANQAQSQSTETNLPASTFAEKMKTEKAVIIDVRTPEEFSKGHLQNARNIDWNGNDFNGALANIDKSASVFVYCLSGARSANAAASMRKQGFKMVYELDGGILQWRANNLPETSESELAAAGMNMAQFNALLQSDKLVLIDFYADWCAPCKKMEPYLIEISKEMADKVKLVRINADDNPSLCKALGVDALPTLQVYNKGEQTWSNVGYLDKAGIVKQLK